MKIEIWSDIMCPFCYIGKRQLESALTEFPNAEFEIEWKSFQLDPTITPQSGKDVFTFLAERKACWDVRPICTLIANIRLRKQATRAN